MSKQIIEFSFPYFSRRTYVEIIIETSVGFRWRIDIPREKTTPIRFIIFLCGGIIFDSYNELPKVEVSFLTREQAEFFAFLTRTNDAVIYQQKPVLW